jgi:hypothetical protein
VTMHRYSENLPCSHLVRLGRLSPYVDDHS